MLDRRSLSAEGNTEERACAQSRAASFTAGHILAVDGGRLAQSESPKTMPFSERGNFKVAAVKAKKEQH
jgi:hypothetical protein